MVFCAANHGGGGNFSTGRESGRSRMGKISKTGRPGGVFREENSLLLKLTTDERK